MSSHSSSGAFIQIRALTALTALFLVQAPSAGAGVGAGGGGQAVLCYKSMATRNSVFQALRSAKAAKSSNNSAAESGVDLHLDELSGPPVLADIFEKGAATGLFKPGKVPPVVNSSVVAIYNKVLAISPKFIHLLRPYITSQSQWHGQTSGVVEISDSKFAGKLPRNCILVQAAYYDDINNVVNYDLQIAKKGGPKFQNSLKIHEDLYRFYRVSALKRNDITVYMNSAWDLDPYTSDSVRPLVNYLMTRAAFTYGEFATLATRVAVGFHYRELAEPVEDYSGRAARLKDGTYFDPSFSVPHSDRK